jgi:hypothetical protein
MIRFSLFIRSGVEPGSRVPRLPLFPGGVTPPGRTKAKIISRLHKGEWMDLKVDP